MPYLIEERDGTTRPVPRALKTLAEHNAQARARHKRLSEPTPNGISCCVCGREMLDRNDGVVSASDPPQVRAFCACCGHEANRVL